MLSEKGRILVSLIPLTLSLVFASGMIFIAYLTTDYSREQYQEKKKRQKMEKHSIDLTKMIEKEFPNLAANKNTDDSPKWFAKENEKTSPDYKILMFAIVFTFPAFVAGFKALGLVGFSKKTIFLTNGIERNLVTGSVAIFLGSLAGLFWYVWMLRNGFI